MQWAATKHAQWKILLEKGNSGSNSGNEKVLEAVEKWIALKNELTRRLNLLLKTTSKVNENYNSTKT